MLFISYWQLTIYISNWWSTDLEMPWCLSLAINNWQFISAICNLYQQLALWFILSFGIFSNCSFIAEAVNITYTYLDRNETAMFMSEFISLDPAVQQSVINGLTVPKTVKTMIRDPQAFISQLCSNMTGLCLHWIFRCDVIGRLYSYVHCLIQFASAVLNCFKRSYNSDVNMCANQV